MSLSLLQIASSLKENNNSDKLVPPIIYINYTNRRDYYAKESSEKYIND